jgi:hypothetical protein
MSSPRRRGPITTYVGCYAKRGHSERINSHRWLWVPDRRSLSLACPGRRRFESHPRIPAARFRPSDARIIRPERTEGAGKAGSASAPAASRAKKTNTRVSHHRFAEPSGLPCAMVLTVYSALSPATNSSCHRRRRIDGLRPRPVGPAKTSADLTPATGARTTRLCRPQRSPFVLRAAIAHEVQPALRSPHALGAAASTASRPNVRDDGQRPSMGRDGCKEATDLGVTSRLFRKIRIWQV